MNRSRLGGSSRSHRKLRLAALVRATILQDAVVGEHRRHELQRKATGSDQLVPVRSDRSEARARGEDSEELRVRGARESEQCAGSAERCAVSMREPNRTEKARKVLQRVVLRSESERVARVCEAAR